MKKNQSKTKSQLVIVTTTLLPPVSIQKLHYEETPHITL